MGKKAWILLITNTRHSAVTRGVGREIPEKKRKEELSEEVSQQISLRKVELKKPAPKALANNAANKN